MELVAFAISITLVLAMAGVSMAVAGKLPDGPVPIHFDIRGKADRFGSRWVVLGILPVTYLLLSVVLLVVAYVLGPSTEEAARESVSGALFAGVLIFLAHLFIVWLLLRWASKA